MPKIMTKTLIATLLWRRLLENRRVHVTNSEIVKFKKNILEYIETNHNKRNYSFETSDNYLNVLYKKEKWLLKIDNHIFLNQDIEHWENEVIFNKDYYDNLHPIIKEAYRNAPLPEIETKGIITYDTQTYIQKIEKCNKKIFNLNNVINDLKKSNNEVVYFLLLNDELKKLQTTKHKLNLEFIENCPHSILYMEKTKSNNLKKCLSCGKIISVDTSSNPCLSGSKTFNEVKSLFDEICTFTKNVDEIITLINIELK